MTAEEIIAKNCHCRRLRAATRTVSRLYDEALRPTGIKGNQLTVLVAVSLMQPVPITLLANRLTMERTTMTRNLRPLQSEGFVEIGAGAGRIRNVSLTAKGKAIIQQAKPLWDTAQAEMQKRLGKENLITMSKVLELAVEESP